MLVLFCSVRPGSQSIKRQSLSPIMHGMDFTVAKIIGRMQQSPPCHLWNLGEDKTRERRRCALDVLVIPADTGLVGRFLFFHRRASKDPDRTHVHVLVRARVSPMWRARVEAAARGLAYQQYRRPARGCCFGICVSPLLAGGTPDRRLHWFGVRFDTNSFLIHQHTGREKTTRERERQRKLTSPLSRQAGFSLSFFKVYSACSSTVASLVLYKIVVSKELKDNFKMRLVAAQLRQAG